MDTQTSEASKDSTFLSAATNNVEHSTISACPTNHVEQSTISVGLTDHEEPSTISDGPDHVLQSTISDDGLVDHSHSDLVPELPNHGFVEGPPFTIQRLSEILLGAENIYCPKLSMLALALEKNLLVTSTLSISSDSLPPEIIETPIGPDKATEEPKQESGPVQNGVERDEKIADGEANVYDDMAFEEIATSSEPSAVPTENS